jgi:DNA polymerase bacteriophage-type
MGETVHIDMETRSLADLKVTGAYRYAQDPSTMVLCMAYAFGDSPVKLWTMDSAPPKDLWAAALDPEVRFAAFNVGFERRIWHFVLHQRLGWPELPVERWHDTQADALAVGFPADLKRCAEALGVEFKKDASGTRLITLLCKPIKGTTKFRGKREFIDQYAELYEYCRQDVRAERAIAKALPIATTADGQERAVWMMTERINDRGVPVDLALAQALWSLIEIDLKDRSVEEITDLTDGQVTSGTQVSRILSLLENPLPDLTAGRVKNTLTCPLLSDHDRALLEARQIVSNRSTAKYDRMLKSAGDDGFVRDILQYHGAATGRYAGRGIQIQNFPRESPKDADEIAKFVSNPVYDLIQIEQKYGPVQKIAKKLLRSTIRAPYRHTLVCRDYSSIEAVGTAWTVRDEAQLDSFRAKKDIYIVTAAEMYHIPEETIGKESMERQAGKIAVLACGYQGGWRALRDFALGYGIHWTPKQAWEIVQRFRTARPRLVAAWENFDQAAVMALRRPGVPHLVEGTAFAEFCMLGRHLRMTLANGKAIWFPDAQIRTVTMQYEDPEGNVRSFTREAVTHMWMNTQAQWVRRSIHGGSLFQSYVQAICREIMVEAMLRLESAGWPLIMSVHDEVVALVPKGSVFDPSVLRVRSVQDFEDIMVRPPEWALDFPIRASGWEGERYRK